MSQGFRSFVRQSVHSSIRTWEAALSSLQTEKSDDCSLPSRRAQWNLICEWSWKARTCCLSGVKHSCARVLRENLNSWERWSLIQALRTIRLREKLFVRAFMAGERHKRVRFDSIFHLPIRIWILTVDEVVLSTEQEYEPLWTFSAWIMEIRLFRQVCDVLLT